MHTSSMHDNEIAIRLCLLRCKLLLNFYCFLLIEHMRLILRCYFKMLKFACSSSFKVGSDVCVNVCVLGGSVVTSFAIL